MGRTGIAEGAVVKDSGYETTPRRDPAGRRGKTRSGATGRRPGWPSTHAVLSPSTVAGLCRPVRRSARLQRVEGGGEPPRAAPRGKLAQVHGLVADGKKQGGVAEGR